ncbi:myo-inosose-2 dehydratase, partial [Leeia sp. TBRC 13508]
LEEGKEIGYQGFELGNKFPKEKEALKAKLGEYGFECVSGWYSSFLAHGTVEEEIDRVSAHLDKLLYNGSNVMVYGECAGTIQGDRSKALYMRPKFTSDAQWQEYAEKVTKFGDWLLARGMRLAYHHHMGAYVETPEDVDMLMKLTGESVGLLFDTGHMTFAGGDALTELKKHINRVCHFHCKDVRSDIIKLARNRNWAFLDSVLNGAFTVPGDGAINFAPILQTLAENGYKGWLVVEA